MREALAASAAGGPAAARIGRPSAGSRRTAGQTMADIEREAILETLERTGGRRAEAARLLGIGLRTLQRKLKEYKDAGLLTRTEETTMEIPAEVLIHNELAGR